jgi:hypothetical protein
VENLSERINFYDKLERTSILLVIYFVAANKIYGSPRKACDWAKEMKEGNEILVIRNITWELRYA